MDAVDAWWSQVLGIQGLGTQVLGTQVHPWPAQLVFILQALAGLGILVIVISVRLSRRWAPTVVIVGWLAFIGSWWVMPARDAGIASGLLAVAATGFWLIDRGVPGNRRRPPWFKLYATCLVGLALASFVLGMRAGHLAVQSAGLPAMSGLVAFA